MSDSSSDDEHEKRLREAIDPTLLTNDIFKAPAPEEDSVEAKNVRTKTPKSQRFIVVEDTSHDEVIPPAMQDFFYKKLSERLERMYEFCDFQDQANKETPEKNYGVKLLKEHKKFVKHFSIPADDPPVNVKRPKIKRRIIETETGEDMNQKLESVSVDGEHVLSKKDTNSWSKRHKGEVFHYKTSKNNTLFYIEPENEFTKLRKKNCWSEKYISTKGKKAVIKK